ncbi:DNA-directed RNA polymerase III subunit 2-like [Salvia hispanica]|uniref:DNA-directed RNA polymerase III subunit 2-like n=1 Tax=Salvia hispanica TaxID=49212 RepID=UPI0020099335|nr:DNA-directed RNA polymerase III subunit 2-like [Salvia hispanica]
MAVDKPDLVSEYLKNRGLVQVHLDSFNHFVRTKIKSIVKEKIIKHDKFPEVYLRYNDVFISEPLIMRNGVTDLLDPQRCRLSDHSYSASIYAKIEYKNGGNQSIQKMNQFLIGRLPIMLKSCCCVLNGKGEEELVRYGECPLDPGGYFIVKGAEKVILMHELPAENNIVVETYQKGRRDVFYNFLRLIARIVSVYWRMGSCCEVQRAQFHLSYMVYLCLIGEWDLVLSMQASVTSLFQTGTTNIIRLEKEMIYLYLNEFTTKVPIIIVLKAMGMEDNEEFVRMIGSHKKYKILLEPSILESEKEGVHTRTQAVNFLRRKVKNPRFNTLEKILQEKFLAKVPLEHKNDLRPKCIHVALMLRRMFKVILDEDTLDDKDYVGNKRLALSGPLLSSLFEDLFQSMNERAHKAIGVHLNKKTKTSPPFDITQHVHAHNITIGLETALSTGNWKLKSGMNLKGVSQVLSRLSYIATMGHMTRIAPVFEKSIHVTDPRALHPSQWGMFCPCDTPVGESCGLVKNLALMAHVTVGEEDTGPLMVQRGVRNFQSFLKEGLIEYLDVNEENDALIASHEEVAKEETTHIEIESFTMFGVVAGLIPYPHHNHSSRIMYQCSIGKQAMGNIAYNQLCRFDNLMHLLVYPQRPLLTTRTIKMVSYDKLGAGQNAIVAVMSYSGYNTGDAIVMNKSSLDRGFGRCIVMKKLVALKKDPRHYNPDRLVRPRRDGSDAKQTQILDDDGLVSPGEIIRDGDIYINKQSPINPKSLSKLNRHYKWSKQTYKGIEGDTAVVDRVALCTDEDGNLCIKYMIRSTRRPEVGDMFSSRHGQKGVCGAIFQQEDLPFSECGVCPDLIINPHGFPGHMTVGTMIELLGSKAGSCCTKFHYGSAFGERSGHADNVEAIGETLVKHGFSYDGKDFLYSGITGEPLQAYIFMGPIYYQKLKHMVIDKMHARGNGPRTILTRQPTQGKSRNGGLRVGEMDRDCLIAFGASMLIQERLMLSSDPYEIQVCQKCGLIGYYSEKLKTGMCSMCKNGKNMSTITIPYACKLLIQELQSMNIVPCLRLKEA